MEERTILFTLTDGTKVYRGDILYHPDARKVGWYCMANFPSSTNYSVTVTSPNGAVPTVLVADLRRNPPAPPERCKTCGQLLPDLSDVSHKTHWKVNDEI